MAGIELLPALCALGSAATWALGSHLFRRALAHGAGAAPPSAAAANLFKNALAFAVFAAVVAASSSGLPESARWPALLLSGFFGFALGDTLYFAALPRCGVQLAAMVALVHVPAAVLLGWILHGERLPWSALLGGALVVLGVACVVGEGPRAAGRDPRARRVGVAFAALGAVAQAAGVVTGHAAMQGVDVLGGTLARMSGGIAGAFVVAAVLGSAARGASVLGEVVALARPWRERGARRGLFLAALFGSVIGLPLFHLALRGLPSGVAAVLFATTPLFTLPLGLALGERHGARAVLGALLGIAGVAAVVAAR
ncbi:MAG: DMT family transporter [Planctomycetes bacterium]|nr:DMT family transporter [Planctomycetota bacterium]